MPTRYFAFTYYRDIPTEIDLEKPGIYEWKITGAGSYIGKSKRLKRRLHEYPNNVRKLVLALPYRANKPASFRAVHHALHQAHVEGRPITLAVIETVRSKCSMNGSDIGSLNVAF